MPHKDSIEEQINQFKTLTRTEERIGPFTATYTKDIDYDAIDDWLEEALEAAEARGREETLKTIPSEDLINELSERGYTKFEVIKKPL